MGYVANFLMVLFQWFLLLRTQYNTPASPAVSIYRLYVYDIYGIPLNYFNTMLETKIPSSFKLFENAT